MSCAIRLVKSSSSRSNLLGVEREPIARVQRCPAPEMPGVHSAQDLCGIVDNGHLEQGIESGFQWGCDAVDLGEQQPALQGREQGVTQLVGVDSLA